MIVVNISKKITAVLLGASLLAGCSISTTRSKDPVFVLNEDSLQQRLVHIISAENINVTGSEVNTNGKINSVMAVEITNGKELPEDTGPLFELGKSVASVLKKALKDEKQFETYKVRFTVKEIKDGATVKTWKEKAFKSDEL